VLLYKMQILNNTNRTIDRSSHLCVLKDACHKFFVPFRISESETQDAEVTKSKFVT